MGNEIMLKSILSITMKKSKLTRIYINPPEISIYKDIHPEYHKQQPN